MTSCPLSHIKGKKMKLTDCMGHLTIFYKDVGIMLFI